MQAPPSAQINKDLILREKLALQRTVLANQTAFLAFLRTSLYFLVAGLSVRSLLEIEHALAAEIGLFSTSALILLLGIINYFRHRKLIQENRRHVGDYQLEYYDLPAPGAQSGKA
jgi:putative membrane protein